MKMKLATLLVLAGFSLANTEILAESLVDGSAEAGKAQTDGCQGSGARLRDHT